MTGILDLYPNVAATAGGLLAHLPTWQWQPQGVGFPVGEQPAAPRQPMAPMQIAPVIAPEMAPAPQPQPDLFDRLINGLGTNGNMLMGAGAALLSGQGFDGALRGAMAGLQADRQQPVSQRQLRALVQATLAPRAGWATRVPRR